MSDRNEAFDKWVSAEHCAEGETVDFCKMGLMREAWYVAWGKALERQAGSQAIEGEPVGWIVHCPRGYKNRPHAVLRSDYNVEAPEFWAGGKPPPDATVIRLYTHPASRQALEGDGEPTAVINKSAVGDYEFFPAPGAVDMPNGMHKLYAHPPITEPCRFHDLDDEACEWKENGDHGWKGSCGVEFYLEDGGPSDNGMKFCIRCGNACVEVGGESVEDGHDDAM